MTKSTQRARDASKAKSATAQRKNRKRTSKSSRADSGHFVKTDIAPEDFKAWSRKRREALIEVLIASLDATDPDPDLEPALGWQGATGFLGESTNQDDPDFHLNADAGIGLGSEPDQHDEPSLGWTEMVRQDGENWHGAGHDLELDHADKEPELGWCNETGRHYSGSPAIDAEATSPEWPAESPRVQPPERRRVAPPVPVIPMSMCRRVAV